jgi:acyl carrier protein
LEDKFTDIGIDSLKIVELILKIEDELNIKLDDSELNPVKLVAVTNIIDLTEKYVLARI